MVLQPFGFALTDVRLEGQTLAEAIRWFLDVRQLAILQMQAGDARKAEALFAGSFAAVRHILLRIAPDEWRDGLALYAEHSA